MEAPVWFQRQCIGSEARPSYPNVGKGKTTAEPPVDSDRPHQSSVESSHAPAEPSHSSAEAGPSTRSSKGKSVTAKTAVAASRAPSNTPSPTEERGRPDTRATRISTRASSAKLDKAALHRASSSSATLTFAPSPAPPPSSHTSLRRPTVAPTPTLSKVMPPSNEPPKRASSSRLEEPGSVSRALQAKEPSGKSKGAAIDVDAMDLDDSPPRKRKLPTAIPMDHLGAPLTVRGSEFKFATVADRDQLESSPSRSPSPDEVRDATVPPVPGSWRDLPRLNGPGQSSVGGTPRLSISASDLRHSTPPTLSSLPDITSAGKEAMPATESLRAIVDTLTSAYQSTRDHAVSLERQAVRIKTRIAAARSEANDRPTAEAFEIWLPEARSIGEDLQSVTKQLASAENWISIITRSLRDFLSSPLEGDLMASLLEEVCKLKDAYKQACGLFAELQEDVRPLRREIYLLRGRADSAEAVAESAAAEAACAVEPLLANLHTLVSAEIQAAQLSVLSPVERLVNSFAKDGSLAPDVVRDIVQGIRAALSEMWRSASSIQRYVNELWERTSAALEARVHALEVRIGQMEGSRGSTGIKTFDSSLGSMERLSNAVDDLSDRLRTLELQVARREELDEHVLNVLAQVGLTSDVIRRLTAL